MVSKAAALSAICAAPGQCGSSWLGPADGMDGGCGIRTESLGSVSAAHASVQGTKECRYSSIQVGKCNRENAMCPCKRVRASVQGTRVTARRSLSWCAPALSRSLAGTRLSRQYAICFARSSGGFPWSSTRLELDVSTLRLPVPQAVASSCDRCFIRGHPKLELELDSPSRRRRRRPPRLGVHCHWQWQLQVVELVELNLKFKSSSSLGCPTPSRT